MLGACLALGAGLILLACDNNSDPVAPDESTITVTADPQTVIIGDTSTITATLRSKTGVRLPDQEITFSTTRGNLDPNAGTSLITDSQGQAISILDTPATATVTARSGSIEGSTQVQTSSCLVSRIDLTVDPGAITSCTSSVNVTATVLDTQGQICSSVSVNFSNPAPTSVGGTFNPDNISTNANGEALSKWQPLNSDCQAQCGSTPSDPNSGNCLMYIRASVGSISSTDEQILDDLP